MDFPTHHPTPEIAVIVVLEHTYEALTEYFNRAKCAFIGFVYVVRIALMFIFIKLKSGFIN
jgi:hypothetical protein